MSLEVSTDDSWSILFVLTMLAIIVLGGLILAMIALRPRSDRSTAFAILAFVANQFVWTFCRLASYGSADPSQSALWLRGLYAAVCLVGVGFLIVALAWTGQTRWLTFRRLVAFSSPSVVLSLSALSDGWHHLFFAAVGHQGTLGGPTFAGGTLYTAYSILTYLYVVVGVWLLARFAQESAGWVRRRTILILVASLPASIAGVVMEVTGVSFWIDVTDLLILIAACIATGSIVRRWFMDLVGTGLAQAIEQMGDAVIIVDSGNRVVDINPAFCDFIQRSRGQVLGQDLTGPAVGLLDNVADPEDLSTVLLAAKASPWQPVDADLEMRNYSRRVYNLRVWPIHAEDDTFIGRVAVLRDVSEARAATRRLMELNGRLAEQTTELTRRANQLAALDQVITRQLISSVSHELRTPLTPIIGYSEMLAMGLYEPTQVKEVADEIRSAAMRMQAIVNDLLDLSRIEAGMLRLKREPVDLSRLIDAAVHDFATLSNRHRIVVTPSHRPLVVVADKVRIRQVLDNLLSNAIKYSPEGGVVTIRATTQRNEVRVAVSDQGPGIPLEQQSRLFEAFYRVEGQLSKRVDGTGLGLAISRHLVDQLGGRIWVQSLVGRGSTFTFSLPLGEGAQDLVVLPPRPSAASGEMAYSRLA